MKDFDSNSWPPAINHGAVAGKSNEAGKHNAFGYSSLLVTGLTVTAVMLYLAFCSDNNNTLQFPALMQLGLMLELGSLYLGFKAGKTKVGRVWTVASFVTIGILSLAYITARCINSFQP